MFCTCRVFDENGPRLTADGSPELRSAMIPSEEVRVLDTWSVVGMIATGSHDVEVDDVFVPAERTSWVEEPVGASRSAVQFSVPDVRRLDALGGQPSRNSPGRHGHLRRPPAEKSATNLSDTILRERQAVQIEAAQSEAIINSARAYLLDAVGTAWMAICDGQPDPSREIAQSRLAITHACHEAVRAVDMLFHAAGTNSIYRQQRIERSFRDVHVGVQHMAAHAYNVEGAGQVLLGLTPSGLGW